MDYKFSFIESFFFVYIEPEIRPRIGSYVDDHSKNLFKGVVTYFERENKGVVCILVIFQVRPICSALSMESSRRDLLDDMAGYRSMLEKIILALIKTPNRPAMPFANRKKNILDDLFSSVLSQFEKISPLWKTGIY